MISLLDTETEEWAWLQVYIPTCSLEARWMRRLPQGRTVKSAEVSIGKTVSGSDSTGKVGTSGTIKICVAILIQLNDELVSWCFKPSQLQRIISGLRETFIKYKYI